MQHTPQQIQLPRFVPKFCQDFLVTVPSFLSPLGLNFQWTSYVLLPKCPQITGFGKTLSPCIAFNHHFIIIALGGTENYSYVERFREIHWIYGYIV